MELLSARNLAKRYPGIGERNIREWSNLRANSLPYYITGKGRMFDPDEFERWFKEWQQVRR